MNCERCDDLFNDLPWRPAEEGNTHTCQRKSLHAPARNLCGERRERSIFFFHIQIVSCVSGCECNGHARRCHFDLATYEASGRRSGGVCEGCMHHTSGPKCDRCAPGYQPNPRSQLDRPDACIRKRFAGSLQNASIGHHCGLRETLVLLLLLLGCPCSTEGTVGNGQCDNTASSCQCKLNVEGPHCDRCKRGYFGLSAANPLGCSSELLNKLSQLQKCVGLHDS